MFDHDQWAVIEGACREIGIDEAVRQRLRDHLLAGSSAHTGENCSARELQVMQLIGATSPQRLVHDVRNLLNEVSLLRALAEIKENE